MTMSEFGRTAQENGNRGTDHGHANCMFVMGGDVKGGKVYGQWPGLEREQLYEGRDLALTTDFRDVLGELVSRHMGNPMVNGVFPAISRTSSGLGLTRRIDSLRTARTLGKIVTRSVPGFAIAPRDTVISLHYQGRQAGARVRRRCPGSRR